jgi:Lon protease-like protein
MQDTPTYGLFVLNLVLVPGERIPLHIFEPRYRELFADCVLADSPFVVVHRDDGAMAQVGCTARFDELIERHDDGRISVVVTGIAPVELLDQVDGHGYAQARCRVLTDAAAAPDTARVADAGRLFSELAEAATGEPALPEHESDLPWSYVLAGHLELTPQVKQSLLEARDEGVRLGYLIHALQLELAAAGRARMAAERAPTNGKVPHD